MARASSCYTYGSLILVDRGSIPREGSKFIISSQGMIDINKCLLSSVCSEHPVLARRVVG